MTQQSGDSSSGVQAAGKLEAADGQQLPESTQMEAHTVDKNNN